jgi:hypothetical protein
MARLPLGFAEEPTTPGGCSMARTVPERNTVFRAGTPGTDLTAAGAGVAWTLKIEAYRNAMPCPCR